MLDLCDGGRAGEPKMMVEKTTVRVGYHLRIVVIELGQF